jgi:hypothetical protein
LAAIFTLLFLTCPALKGQTLPMAGDPIVATVTATDELGNVLYHRQAFIFFAGITEYGIGDTHLVAKTSVSIYRVLRENGSRCDPVLPTDITESCSVIFDYCAPPQTPKVRR